MSRSVLIGTSQWNGWLQLDGAGTYRDGMPRSATGYRWHISFPGRVLSLVGSYTTGLRAKHIVPLKHADSVCSLIPCVRHRVDTDVRFNLDVVRTRIRYLYPLMRCGAKNDDVLTSNHVYVL